MIPQNELPEEDLLPSLRTGNLRSAELVNACLKKINETDQEIRAWAHVDHQGALGRAEELDKVLQQGGQPGPMHGMPVGLKDIIATSDMPTEYGSPIFRDHRTDYDAALVEKLRTGGAVILGKTVTTEFAFMHASQTRNPKNLEYSPGGSSSGSAAAVSAGQVPMAVGTQTGGSVIRPASFCGVYGFKPTRGRISRTGVFETSKTFDQIGTFGRTLDDAFFLADVIADDQTGLDGPDQSGSDTSRHGPDDFRLLWLEMPYVSRLPEDAKTAFEKLIFQLGDHVSRQEPSDLLRSLSDVHQTIYDVELLQNLSKIADESWDRLSDTIKPVLQRAKNIPQTNYKDALGTVHRADQEFSTFFDQFDAILTPSALGEAPKFGPGTGDSICCKTWTLGGLPCVSLPLLVGKTGLPIGVQLVGGQGRDKALLATARSVIRTIGQSRKS